MSHHSIAKVFHCIVTEVCRRWAIPNITYALVHDQQVIDVQSCVADNFFSRTPSTEKLFRIGSNSKAFVCTALVELEKQGKLSLNDKVVDYLPDFRMHADMLTKQVKIRNLVTHSTGIGKFTSCLLACLDYSTESIVRSLRYLKPIAPFNKSFQYNNALYTVAGKLIETVTHVSCHQYFQENFFSPLKMDNTHTALSNAYRPLLAIPHIEYQHQTIPIQQSPAEDVFEMGGNIISNVHDLAKWLLFNLKITTCCEKKFSYYQQLFQPQIPLIQPANINQLYHYLNATSYLMGWQQVSFKQYKIFEHMGTALGYTTSLSFCPQLKSGLILLANKNDLWNPIGLLLINFYELLTTRRHSNLIPIIKKQHDHFRQSLQAKLDAMQPFPLPKKFQQCNLHYRNAMYGHLMFDSNSHVASLTLAPKKIKIVLDYLGNDKFKFVDEYFNVGEQFKLITLCFSGDAKLLTMEIFMDNHHGDLSWVDTQTFYLVSKKNRGV
ncbi:MAG: hypothetical protein A2103_03625 [Gammaproteobacteria bacterium GWF2_41_13]|nr:MAG: hypothetical protein A2103_03625 [Gammaproteobacteria bacterium GWF2_41_13]